MRTGSRAMLRYVATLLFAFSAVALGAAENLSKVNGGIRVDPGRIVGDVSSVNGSITIGAGSSAREVKTVNGSVRVDEKGTVESAGTVNGAITLAEKVQVRDDVETVNGEIRLREGSRVGGQLSNVNGALKLYGARVGAGIETVNGDVLVGAGSRVEGGIQVLKSRGWSRNKDPDKPRVTIESGAVVNGTLRFEREVDLYLGNGVTLGAIEGVQPQRHSL
jgi:DUF4097 and DUF4098 domain-containing protein YvlB